METNKVASRRADKPGILAITGLVIRRKSLLVAAKEIIFHSLKKVIYLGNDINDLEAIMIVGYPVCPSDAYKKIKNLSILILNARGGEGVVKELLECMA